MTSPEQAALHDTLLRVAGWVPDDLLADARARLAGGRLGHVVRSLVFCGARTVLPLTDEDLILLARLLVDDGGDADAVDAIELVAFDSPSPWWFTANPPEAGDHAEDVDGDALIAALAGEALVTAMSGEPGVRGLWCAWRAPADRAPYPPPRPVYVVEAGELADLAALTGRLQHRLGSAGDAVPQVEVVAVGADVPAYQRQARGQGSLLWAPEPAAEIAVARVFDAVDAETGPSFAPDHPRMTDDEERARTLAYLRAGTVLLLTMATLEDVVDRARGAVVPMNFRTDGAWIWNDTVSYYLEEHQLAPDPALLRHIRAAGGPPPAVDTVTLQRAGTVLTRPRDVEPVWVAS